MAVNSSGLSARLPRIRAAIADALQSYADEVPYLLSAYIEENWHESGGGEPNLTDKLYVRSGKLARSYIPGQPGNLSEVKMEPGKVRVRFGTTLVYASVHEYGGFIKSKGRMHKALWAKYYKTGNPFFKFAALSVEKKGGVRIKARPFHRKAVRTLATEGKERIMRRITTIIARGLKG